jgi:predicted kinase
MDILRRRVEERSQRRDDASEAGTEVLGRQSGWWEPFTAAERAAVLEIDTAAPDASARALNLLRP